MTIGIRLGKIDWTLVSLPRAQEVRLPGTASLITSILDNPGLTSIHVMISRFNKVEQTPFQQTQSFYLMLSSTLSPLPSIGFLVPSLSDSLIFQ